MGLKLKIWRNKTYVYVFIAMSWFRKQSTKDGDRDGQDSEKKQSEKVKLPRQKMRGLFVRLKSHDKSKQKSDICDRAHELTRAGSEGDNFVCTGHMSPPEGCIDAGNNNGETLETPGVQERSRQPTKKSKGMLTQATGGARYPLMRGDEVDDMSHSDGGEFEEYHLSDIEYVADSQPTSPGNKRENRLYHIANELLSTEETYVTKLKVLHEIAKQTSENLDDEVSNNLFPNISSVYTLHNDNLLPELKQRISNWNNNSRLGDVMCRLTPFLKLYTEFVKNFQNATQKIHSWRQKSATFDRIIISNTRRVSGLLGIDALMIEPIQRVPRYKLLLIDYLKHLPESSEDVHDVKKALEQVSAAAEHFESMIKRDAQIETLHEIQNSLVGGRNIFSISRKLLKIFAVYQISRSTGLKEDCKLYLFNDILMITVENVGSAYGSKKQRMKHLIDLSKIKVNDGSNVKLPFCLKISTRMIVVEIGLRNSSDMQELKKLLHAQMADSAKRKVIRRGTWTEFRVLTKKLSLGENAPQFVPFHTVSVCMSCGEQFVSQRKKKHCAACGMVVCGRCSMNKEVLSYDPSAPQRVCLKCHEVFEKHRKSSVT